MTAWHSVPAEAWPSIIGYSAAAGVVSVLATVAVERWGGRLGGILATIPTTIVPATMGLLASHPDVSDPASLEGFRMAIAIVPVGMLINAAFLASWHVLPKWLHAPTASATLWRCIVGSLALWAVLSLGWVLLMRAAALSATAATALGVGALVVTAVLGVVLCSTERPSPRGMNLVPWAVLAARGVGAGLAIVVALVIAQTGHAILGGMAVTFPAIFLTTIVGTWMSHGREVPAGAVGPMVLGSCAVGGYALLAGVVYPQLGVVWGGAVCWIAAVGGISVPAGWWLGAHRLFSDQE